MSNGDNAMETATGNKTHNGDGNGVAGNKEGDDKSGNSDDNGNKEGKGVCSKGDGNGDKEGKGNGQRGQW